MPKLTYKKDDSYFYKWWKEIYQQQLDLYKKFSTPGIVFAPLTDKDFENWRMLRAYYFGLCDGRKKNLSWSTLITQYNLISI